MKITDIKDPKFLKKYNTQELNVLCSDIREFIIDNLSKTGGHVASNLGIVELTVGLHYVFNSPEDKIIFDVGHQSYIHKILTGRANKFSSLRQLGGLSGYQKRKESKHDPFEAGHSSTSIAAALGFAYSRDLNKEKNEVIAVIGDGSLTGGLAFDSMFTDWISERVKFIADVHIYPGEDELEALAEGGLRLLIGEEEAKVYK